MDKSIEKYKEELLKELTKQARFLYSCKDNDNRMRMSGMAKAIQIVKQFKVK